MSRMWNRRDWSGGVMPNISAPGLLILVVIIGIPVLIPRPTVETPGSRPGPRSGCLDTYLYTRAVT